MLDTGFPCFRKNPIEELRYVCTYIRTYIYNFILALCLQYCIKVEYVTLSTCDKDYAYKVKIKGYLRNYPLIFTLYIRINEINIT